MPSTEGQMAGSLHPSVAAKARPIRIEAVAEYLLDNLGRAVSYKRLVSVIGGRGLLDGVSAFRKSFKGDISQSLYIALTLARRRYIRRAKTS
jgi:hypothetical protein